MNQKTSCPVCGYDRSRDAGSVPSLVRLRQGKIPFGGGRAPEPERTAELEAHVAELEQKNLRLSQQAATIARELDQKGMQKSASPARREEPQSEAARHLARITRQPDAPDRQLESSAWMSARSADGLWQAGKTPGSIRPQEGAQLPAEVSVPAEWDGQPVTRLEDSAFKNTRVRRVVLPEGLREIGANCFDECWELAEVTLPSTLRAIGPGAFRRCGKLDRVKLPDGISAVEDETFANCTSLREAVLPAGLTKMGESAFAACRQLERMTLPDGISIIRREAFLGCSLLRELMLPQQLRWVESRAFYGCGSLRTLQFPRSLEGIAQDAFTSCRSLTRLVLPFGMMRKLPALPSGCQVEYRS